jgi:hypothetical protein
MAMQKIQFFLSSLNEDENNHELQLVEEVTGYDLPSTSDDIWQLFTAATEETRLNTHLYYKGDVVAPNESTAGPTEKPEPATGWHDECVYSVFYEDIEVLIDRTIVGNLDIRVWRNGRDDQQPHAVLSVPLADYICSSCGGSELGAAECGHCELCFLCCPHDDPSDQSGPFHVIRTWAMISSASGR